MKERIIFGFDPFVIPFTLGMVFIILYLITGTVRIIFHLSAQERKNLLKLVFSLKLFKTIKEIITDVLLHVKIFKKNLLLGYMHASIAFGWFMLIVIGHVEVLLYIPQRNGVLYYPIFFRYFVMETNQTLRGGFFFFLMDLFLLMVLSGIALAIYKRFKSRRLGMKKTTKHKPGDRIALTALWLIFPLRLLAESFTADISGGSFLTKSVNSIIQLFPSYDALITPIWWAYSISLGIFFFALPFSRYMHIPTEILLIFLRNAGIVSSSSRDGFAETEIYSCSSCGICIDVCPMISVKDKTKFTSVYLIRELRRRKEAALATSSQCLMCNKCVEACPVGIDSTRLKLLKKQEEFATNFFSYINLNNGQNIKEKTSVKEQIFDDKQVVPNKQVVTKDTNIANKETLLYYAGCMTHLTPAIYEALFKILNKASVNYSFMDKDGSICCGRPLILAGAAKHAKSLIEKNREIIKNSGASVLLLSCPICYKVFKEEYNLEGIKILHHSEYINELIKKGKIKIEKTTLNISYHDPCDLGRGSGIYEQPRELLSTVGTLVKPIEEREMSACCGGALASTKFSYEQRNEIVKCALTVLNVQKANVLVTSCPLCLKTFSPIYEKETMDIAQIVYKQMI
ncbi:MAG: (Fe-S)-binding protein [Bacteroidales bacterium]